MTHPIYALFVTSERRAAKELSEAGFEVWAPTYRRQIPGRERTTINQRVRGRESWSNPRMSDSPVIPGYVFARIEPGRFRDAKTDHVISIVSADGFPAPVPEDDFARLLLMVMTGKLDEPEIGGARARGRRNRAVRAMTEWMETLGKRTRKAA